MRFVRGLFALHPSGHPRVAFSLWVHGAPPFWTLGESALGLVLNGYGEMVGGRRRHPLISHAFSWQNR